MSEMYNSMGVQIYSGVLLRLKIYSLMGSPHYEILQNSVGQENKVRDIVLVLREDYQLR